MNSTATSSEKSKLSQNLEVKNLKDLNLEENKIRQKIQLAFEELLEKKSVSQDIAFHLTDWISDLRDLIETYSKIDNLSNDEITSFVYKFLAHVPNHLNAAYKLSGFGKVEDVFQVGIFEDEI
jgi:hypothetical protein